MAIRRYILLLLALGLVPAARAQQVSGRFVLEKEHFLVGEPVFVVLQVKNEGSEPVRVIDDECPRFSVQFEAPTATPLAGPGLYGCGAGGFAGDCLGGMQRLTPGQSFHRRYLLDGDFRFTQPGSYAVHAHRTVPVVTDDSDNRSLGSEEVSSDLTVVVERGDEAGLRAAYQPLLEQAKSADAQEKLQAVRALAQNPPAFLEKPLLALADDPQAVIAVIPGLARLATEASLKKLAELSAPGKPEYLRQPAITALGEAGGPEYCDLMLKLASGADYSAQIALRAAGRLCGERALPEFRRRLAVADDNQRFELAYALGNTDARAALPMLIDLLADRTSTVRRAAENGLETLTHRSVPVSKAPAAAQQQWTRWWLGQGSDAPIFDTAHCAAATPLD